MFRITAALLLTATVLQTQTPPGPTISKFDRGASLTMLRQIKVDLKDNYYDKSFRGLDMDAVFAEAEQKLKASTSTLETMVVLADVLLRLNDSHTMFYPPDRVTRVDYGWTAAMIGDAPYVIAVKPRSDAEKKGLAVGDRVLFWNRYEPTRQVLWQLYYMYTFIRPQVQQRIVVRKPDGAEKVLDIASNVEPRSNQLSDVLDEMITALEVKVDREQMAGDTLVWRYSGFKDDGPVQRGMKMARRP